MIGRYLTHKSIAVILLPLLLPSFVTSAIPFTGPTSPPPIWSPTRTTGMAQTVTCVVLCWKLTADRPLGFITSTSGRRSM
jgi:hypothetical protein